MLLRTRIVLIFGVASLLLLVAVVLPLWIVQRVSERSLMVARQEAQAAEWEAALADVVTPYEILGSQLAADPALRDAVERDDVQEAVRLLGQALATGRVSRLDLMSADGRMFASSAGSGVDTPLIDATNLRARIQQDPWLQGVETGPDGTLLVVSTSQFPGGRYISVAAPAAPMLPALARGGERDLFLVGRTGALLMATSPGEWPAVAAARAEAGDRAALVERERRSFNAVSTPLLNTAGLQIATLVMVRDVTAAVQRRTLVLLVTGGAGALAFAALLLGLYGYARGALDPLSEITRVIRAMAGGDATISADIPNRKDEVGAIAGAVEVFRRDIVALARKETRETLRHAQQQALMRREMEALAEVLEPEERAALVEGLRADRDTGTALAEGFERMSSMVIGQHKRLADLLAERTRDLEIVRQALAERAHLSRLRQELEVARHLQLSSLPQVFPPFPDRSDFEVYAAMEPAKEVGGDFYDFALMGGDRLAIMIGDASGKGVSAAMFIGMGRSILRSAMVRGASPAQALALANSTLAVENHTMMFATVFAAVLDLHSGWLTFASAGHNPPYMVDVEGRVVAMGTAPGVALGIMEDCEYEDEELQLQPGANLVLFTDGVTEANDPALAMFGEERLEAELAKLAQAGPEVAVAAIQEAVRRFAEGAEQADDITVLAARWLGPADGDAGLGAKTGVTIGARLPARPEV